MTGTRRDRGLWGVEAALKNVGRRVIRQEEVVSPTLEDLYVAHSRDVFRLVSRLLGPGSTGADVDDLVQEVFMTVDRALTRYRGTGTPYSFVYGVTTRVVMRYLRGRRRYHQMIDRFENATAIESALPPNPEETAAQRERVRRVWSALLRLKPERRVVFILFQLEGRSAVEIGRALDLSEEAVRSRLRRARTEVTKLLTEQGGSD